MKVLLREEIPERYTWDLSFIISGKEEWESLYKELDEGIVKLAVFEGKLGDEDTVYECLKEEYRLSQILERLYVYAQMKQDENAADTQSQAMKDRAEMISVRMASACSFILPELTDLPTQQLERMAKEERFSDSDYALREIIRLKAHVLSDKEEKLLSEVGSFTDGFHDAFSMFDNVDVQYDPVSVDGKEIEMSHGVYGLCMQNPDRKVREDAFRSMFSAYKDMINTLTMLYAGNVKKNCFFAKVRKYPSALDKAVSSENVPKSIYETLVKGVHKALPVMHRYVSLRRKALGYGDLHMWDMHVPIVEGCSLELEYEEACRLVKEALKPLGEEYAKLLDRAFSERWIDVYENKGKRSGAYSWGSYNAHPYVLLNYQKTTHDVFTIAHELGHAMHSYYSNTSQPYSKAGYEIFVAEVASTVNEVLLLKYLMKNCEGNERKYYLSYYADMFRTTLFRQTQFAEFEKVAHETYESDSPLTPEGLSEEYYKLNKQYYGDDVTHDELIKYEWARIPHFYRSFYVYKYATGITSAVVIASNILKGKNVDGYMKFLSMGGSMPSNDILKFAGVDLTTQEPFDIVMKEFGDTVDELERLQDKD